MSDQEKGMTYADAGVDYVGADAFKRECQAAARTTAPALDRHGMREVSESRGQSAYLIECTDHYLVHVEEGLGTKNLVADVLLEVLTKLGRLVDETHYDQLAQCTVGTIANDLATSGADPISIAQHLAVQSSDWFKNGERNRALINGWRKACEIIGAVWGPGETPVLNDIIVPGASLLSGSAIGIIKPKSRRIRGEVAAGDRIILVESSGIHANGLSLARKIAKERLGEKGYLTKLPSGRTYGEVVLDATVLYGPLISACLDRGIDIHAAINITGHGWRKLMRSKQAFSYQITHLPRLPEIFPFMMKHGPVDKREAYRTLNMGAGFALIVPPESVAKVWDVVQIVALPQDYRLVNAGSVEPALAREVKILPKDIMFAAHELDI